MFAKFFRDFFKCGHIPPPVNGEKCSRRVGLSAAMQLKKTASTTAVCGLPKVATHSRVSHCFFYVPFPRQSLVRKIVSKKKNRALTPP
jgi:hypothetical protein